MREQILLTIERENQPYAGLLRPTETIHSDGRALYLGGEAVHDDNGNLTAVVGGQLLSRLNVGRDFTTVIQPLSMVESGICSAQRFPAQAAPPANPTKTGGSAGTRARILSRLNGALSRMGWQAGDTLQRDLATLS